MSVDLSWFDPMGWTLQRADMERALYVAACTGDGGAATELQFWQAKFGSLEAKDVEASLREGQLHEQLRSTAIATTPNQRHGAEWHQLQAFGVSERKTGPKSSAKILELHHAFGQRLTIVDLRAAATTEFATKTKKKEKPRLARKDWPETVEEVECELVAYVCHHFKGTEPQAARAYVRDSFPGMPWNQPDELVDYPPHW